MRFVDRMNELEKLESEYRKNAASFVVVYGRRRIGKTALINHFCEGKKAIYFLATEESESENRTAFKKLVADTLDNELLAQSSLNSWEPIFKVIASESRHERTILVIDEFQYLGKANSSFPSIMQKIWDTVLSKANVMLILCGSLINMMTAQVLNYNSPLFGRRTAQMKLKQIAFSYYHEFNEKLDPDEQIMRYAVTGGVPKYIDIFQDEEDIYVAIRKNVLSTSAFLYAEPEFLLEKEVSEVGSYFSILKTIAAGNHKLGKIAAALEVPQTKLTSYLKNLIDLDILEREVPVTEENPEKSKMGLYKIRDNFILFWFKFVYPNRSLLESGRTDFVEAKIRKNLIDNHVSYIYEDICRERIWDLLSDSLEFNRVGRWWGAKDVKIDIVAYDSNGRDIVFGECKYSRNQKGLSVLNDLKEKSKKVNWKKAERTEHFVIYSKNGFSDELLEYADKNPNIYLRS